MFSLKIVESWPAANVSVAVVAKSGKILETIGSEQKTFNLASVTKLLTTYVALIALEESAISLDTPAGPVGSTVKHLLSHTSGYDFDNTKIFAPPGERRIYSNLGIEILAKTITQHSGILFTEYAQEALFDPLRMVNTKYFGSPAAESTSNLADLIIFLQELQQPKLISPITLKQATSIVFPQTAGILPGFGRINPNPWGLGFEIRDTKTPHWTGTKNSTQTFGHFGQSGTFLWVDPLNEIACVVLTDENFGQWAKDCWPKFSDMVLNKFIKQVP